MASPPLPVLSYLSGSARGTSVPLEGDHIVLGHGPDVDVTLPTRGGVRERALIELRRRGQTYEMIAQPGVQVWVNGEEVDQIVLQSGDMMELGGEGLVIRYRIYESAAKAHKTLGDIFSDCLECARQVEGGWLTKSGGFAMDLSRQLATQTSKIFRFAVVVFLISLTVSTAVLARRSQDLEARLLEGALQVAGIVELVEQRGEQEVTAEDLQQLASQLAEGLDERLTVLEERSSAPARVIAEASSSTFLIQGSYTFVDPKSERPLRRRLDAFGNQIRNTRGEPALTLEGEGPVLEILHTGTAFLSEDDLLVTNRHVARPWEFDNAAKGLIARGFVATLGRLLAFVPGKATPLQVTTVGVSETADLAILRAVTIPEGLTRLMISSTLPQPGDEVLVMGYPLGLKALLARTDAEFLEKMRATEGADFWAVALMLAEAGHVRPLATRGIVGQASPERLVYDAETTSGGSGGPVLDLNGQVVAINAAILPEFGGSNLGVPAGELRALFDRARER